MSFTCVSYLRLRTGSKIQMRSSGRCKLLRFLIGVNGMEEVVASILTRSTIPHYLDCLFPGAGCALTVVWFTFQPSISTFGTPPPFPSM